MKFKIDENLPFVLKSMIEAMGNHVVDSVFHENLSGMRDSDLLSRCFEEKRIFITLDEDFPSLTLSPKHPYYGVILLRPDTQGKQAVRELFQKFLDYYNLEDVCEKFITIEPAGIKIRQPPEKKAKK